MLMIYALIIVAVHKGCILEFIHSYCLDREVVDRNLGQVVEPMADHKLLEPDHMLELVPDRK